MHTVRAWRDTSGKFHRNRSYHFLIAVWRAKKAESHRVNSQKATLVMVAMLSVSIALADDFKTVNGKEYKNATVSRVEPDGIVIKHKSGISKVYFTELPKDVQERFHPSPAKTAAAQRQREPIKLETKQDGRRQADEGRRVVVVGQGAVTLKVFVVGIVVLVGVLMAFIRSRY